MSLAAVLFRVELIDLFIVAVVWCAVKESEVLSTKRSAVAENLGALGAIEPHGRGAGKQWTSPAGRLAVAVDCDMDVNLRWRGI